MREIMTFYTASGRKCMRGTLLRKGAVLAAVVFALTGLGAEKKKLTEAQSWAFFKAYTEKLSEKSFNKLTKSRAFRIAKRPRELAFLRNVASRMSRAAGYGDYTRPIEIIEFRPNPRMVNAMTFPGGQIVFMTGMLYECKKYARIMARRNTPLNKKLGYKKAAEAHYEGLLAAVMGHELGHYFGQHFMQRYAFKVKNFSSSNTALKLREISYGQKQELESDEFSLRMMAKIGMDPDYMAQVLGILKRVRQRYLRRGKKRNPYLESHPTGNRRLAAAAQKAKSKAFFTRLANLERAFAAVETGRGLEKAAEVLESELKRYPKNVHLLSTAAKVYHRLWEESCAIDKIGFKASIASSTFHDRMIPTPGNLLGSGTSPRRGIPGDEALYRKAEKMYRVAIKNHADLMTQSSFAALLSYDPKKADEAVDLAELAVSGMNRHYRAKRYMAINNLGIAYYYTENYRGAEKSFKQAAGVFGRTLYYKSRYSKYRLKRMSRYHQIMTSFSARNMGRLYESVFNLGQLYNKTGKNKKAVKVWKAYVTRLDWTSEWAKYAALRASVDIAKLKSKPVPMAAGVGPGTPILKIVRKWGKPDKRHDTFFGMNMWTYNDEDITLAVRYGFVRMIRLKKKSRIKLSNGIRIGMSQAAVERRIGKPPLKRGRRVRYPRHYMMLTYDQGRVQEIMISK